MCDSTRAQHADYLPRKAYSATVSQRSGADGDSACNDLKKSLDKCAAAAVWSFYTYTLCYSDISHLHDAQADASVHKAARAQVAMHAGQEGQTKKCYQSPFGTPVKSHSAVRAVVINLYHQVKGSILSYGLLDAI